jgi:hypothetical protein
MTIANGDSSPTCDIEQAVSPYSGSHLDGVSQTLDKASGSSYVNIQARALVRTYDKRCPCQCHIRQRLATPQWFRALLGVTFAEFTGTPVLNQRSCNFRKCHNGKRSSGSARISYVFPIWLLRTVISFTASWNSLYRISGTWSLRMPQNLVCHLALAEMCQSFKYGSVLDISRVMESLGIRAYDYLPHRRWQTLLGVRIMKILMLCCIADSCSWLPHMAVTTYVRCSLIKEQI